MLLLWSKWPISLEDGIISLPKTAMFDLSKMTQLRFPIRGENRHLGLRAGGFVTKKQKDDESSLVAKSVLIFGTSSETPSNIVKTHV